MKKLLIVLVAIAFLTTAAFAGSTDTQTVYYEIDAINEIAMDADLTLTVNAADAGSEPNMDLDNSQTYDITTNTTAGKKITVAINANMPANTTLIANMIAPTGGSTGGAKNLTTTAQDAVTSIETVAESGVEYNLTLTATVAAGLPADGSRVITFTLTDS
ncbi:MAG: hypothetical protein ABIH00_11300 [Armatimonadota bacterium]